MIGQGPNMRTEVVQINYDRTGPKYEDGGGPDKL